MCDVQVMDLGIRAFMLVLSQNPGRYGRELTYFKTMLLSNKNSKSVHDQTVIISLPVPVIDPELQRALDNFVH
jgi:hypothetical protein